MSQAEPEDPVAEVADVLTALSEQAARWQADLARARGRVSSLSSEPGAGQPRVLLSPAQASLLVAELLAAGASRIVHVHPGGTPFLDLREVYQDLPADRRTQVRELISRPAALPHSTPGTIRHCVRTTWAELPEMVVVDDAAALIPYPEADRPLNVAVVRQRAVVSQLAHFFDTTWIQSTPPDEPVPQCSGAESELKSRIILLLAEGAKDEAVARRLGISLRTCRRHVAEILGQLDASSRFQAGARAAQLGLVPTTRPQLRADPPSSSTLADADPCRPVRRPCCRCRSQQAATTPGAAVRGCCSLLPPSALAAGRMAVAG